MSRRKSQKIYSLNNYRKAYEAQPYNLLKGVRIGGKSADVPVSDVVFAPIPPTHAKFLGYFDRLPLSVPPYMGVPNEILNRPLSIPLTRLCSVWANPEEQTVWVVSDKAAEEVAPLPTWADDKVEERDVTHGQVAEYNYRAKKMKEYRKLLAMRLDSEVVPA